MSCMVRNPDFCLCEGCVAKTKAQISLAVTAKLISAFVFATQIVFLNLKFQASSLLLCLYRSVCVRPGRKPQRPYFIASWLIFFLILVMSTTKEALQPYKLDRCKKFSHQRKTMRYLTGKLKLLHAAFFFGKHMAGFICIPLEYSYMIRYT